MDTTFIFILIGAAVVIIGAAFAYNATRDTQGNDPLQERLARYASEDIPDSLEKIELSLSFKDRIGVPVMRWMGNIIARFTPQQQLDQARKLLEQANSTQEPGIFVLSRILYTIVAFVAAVLAFFVVKVTDPTPTNALLYTVGLTYLGYMQPVSTLKGKIRRRQEAFVRA